MRLSRCLLAVSVLYLATYPTLAMEETRLDDPQSKPTYSVRCRWINQHGQSVKLPVQTLTDGAQGNLSKLSQSPFVTGVTKVIDPRTKKSVKRPYMIVLEEGIKINLVIYGRQTDGATVDVTIELSKIGNVDTKRINPETTIQIPSVDIQKKRVIDFAKFGQSFVVPIGNKPVNGSQPCLEIVIDDGVNSSHK